jgi:hypothetical protein
LYDPAKASQYRHQAGEILGWAANTNSAEQRRILLEIAAMYHRFARHLEDGEPMARVTRPARPDLEHAM